MEKTKILIFGATGFIGRNIVECLSGRLDFQVTAVSHSRPHFDAGRAVKIKDLVLRIIAASGKGLRIKHDLSKPSIPTTLFLDCNRVRHAFGWSPRVALDEGILRTLEWYGANIGHNLNTQSPDPEAADLETDKGSTHSAAINRSDSKTPMAT